MKTVLCHGCFDMLHIGHVRHLQAARALGDRLVVSVTADRWVNKGPGRPVVPENERMEMLLALRCVDQVVISHRKTCVGVIASVRPEIYAKGKEYFGHTTDDLAYEMTVLRDFGGELVFTDTPEFHSTDLIERILSSQGVV